MSGFDELAEKAGDDQWEEWKARILTAKDEIAAFVASHIPAAGDTHGVTDWFAGSFNLALRVSFSKGPDAIIRFPGPGHTTCRDEKVINEVQVITFLHEQTTIPVPRLLSWGLTKDSLQQFGPFIISDFVAGIHLSDILKDPAHSTKLYLNPNIDNHVLDTIYEQLADILLQLFQFDFSSIGAISKDPASAKWIVKERPLTYSMNELATTAFYPVDKFATAPFTSSRDYFKHLSEENITQLWTQRNVCNGPDEARAQYTARHLFPSLIDKFCIEDSGPFKLFCDDFRPQNILVDPDTLHISAVLDLEFTNALPSQFSSDPPWWLLLAGPESYLFRGHSIDEFLSTYQPRLEQFLQAMQRVEKTRPPKPGQKALSIMMRESWESKRFWFDYAARKPFDIDVLFNSQLEDGLSIESLDEKTQATLESFVNLKMEQLAAYDRDCSKLFSPSVPAVRLNIHTWSSETQAGVHGGTFRCSQDHDGASICANAPPR